MIVTILEIQETDGAVAILANEQRTVQDNNSAMDALSLFHTKCSYAAISSCKRHTIRLIDETGEVWNGCKATFTHSTAEE